MKTGIAIDLVNRRWKLMINIEVWIDRLKKAINSQIYWLISLERRIKAKGLRSYRQRMRFYHEAGICTGCLTHTGCSQNRGKLSLAASFFLLLLVISQTAQAGTITGAASWYSVETCKMNFPQCTTASMKYLPQLESDGIPFAAMWGVPFGTKVRVRNLNNNKTAIAVIEDRGPSRRLMRERGLVIDLSKKVFSEIGDLKDGRIPVEVEVLS